MKNIKVDGHPDLARDAKSGAIINDNGYSYQKYMESYKLRKEKEERLDKIEEDIQELKDLLKTFLKNNSST